jgi:hypothetical protein
MNVNVQLNQNRTRLICADAHALLDTYRMYDDVACEWTARCGTVLGLWPIWVINY